MSQSIVLEHYSHAGLYVDLTCYQCKRPVALANAVELDGRKYHERCLPPKTLSDDTTELFRIHRKAPELENFLNGFGQSLSGNARNSGKCVFCADSKVLSRKDFKDDLSWKEFGISRLCQKCQDQTFGA